MLEHLDKSCLSPRRYPWRFCVVLGISAGFLLPIVEMLGEGFPENFRIVILRLIIFVTVELTLTLLVVRLLGRFLGIRPYAYK